MTTRASGDFLSLPVRLHGIELGRVVDVILDLESMRLLGLEVRCGDDVHRFLPLAAVRLGDGQVTVGSALLLLDELPFYRRRGQPLRTLRGAAIDVDGIAVGKLEDVLAAPDGRLERVVVEGAGGARELRVSSGIRIHQRRAPAA